MTMTCVYGARTLNNKAAMEQQVKRNLPELSKILDPEHLFINISHVLHDFDVQKIEKSLKLDYADPMLVVRIYTVLKRRENWTAVFIKALTTMREYEALRLLGIEYTEPQPEEDMRSEKHPTVSAQPIADRSLPRQMTPSSGQSRSPYNNNPHLSQTLKGNNPSSLESSQPSNLSFSFTPSDNSYLPFVGQKGAMVNPHSLNDGRLYSCDESMGRISQTGTHGRVGNERGVSLPNAGPGRPQANVGPGRPQANVGPGRLQANVGPGGLQSYAGPGIPTSAQQSGVTLQDLANNFKESLPYPAYPHEHPSDGPIQTEQRRCERGRHMDQPHTTNGTSDPGPHTSFAPTGTLPTTSQVHPRDFSPNIVQSIDDNMDSGLASEDFTRRSIEQKEDNIGNNLSEERSRQGKTNSTAGMKTSDGELQTDTDLLTDDAQPEQEEDGVSEAAERGRAHSVRLPGISQVRGSHIPSECQCPHSPPAVHINIHKLIANVAQFTQDGYVNMSAQDTLAHPTPGPVPEEEGRSRFQAESCSAQRSAYTRTSDTNTASTPSHSPCSNPRQDTAIKTVRESHTVGNRAPSGSERESLLQQETQQEGLTELSGFTPLSDLSALTDHQTQLKMGWEREEVGLTSRDRQPYAQMTGERTETCPEQYQLQSSPDLSTFRSAPAYHETEPKVISDDEDDDENVHYHERTDYTTLDTRLTKSDQAKADSHETYPKKRSLQETDETSVKESDRRQTRNMSDWQRETTLAHETELQETKAAECNIHQSHPNTCSQEDYKTADHQTTPKEILDEEYDYHQNQKGDGWTRETDISHEAQTANNAESGDAEMYHKIGLLKSTKNADNQTELQRRRATENSALEQAPTNQQTQFQMYSHGSSANTSGAKTEGRSREKDGVKVFDQMKETAGWQTKHLQKNGGKIAEETLQPVQRRDPSSGICGRNPTVASLGVEESSSLSQAGPRNPTTKTTQFGNTGDLRQGNIPAVLLVHTRAPSSPSSSTLSRADFQPRPLLGPDSLDRLERQENAVLELPSFELSLEA